jgi:hypothetical protein
VGFIGIVLFIIVTSIVNAEINGIKHRHQVLSDAASFHFDELSRSKEYLLQAVSDLEFELDALKAEISVQSEEYITTLDVITAKVYEIEVENDSFSEKLMAVQELLSPIESISRQASGAIIID